MTSWYNRPLSPCECGCGTPCRGRWIRGHYPREEQSARQFWANVERGSSEQCWLWTGRLSRDGYGHFGMPKRRTGLEQQAHRRVWVMTNGPIPAGMCVLHHCDTPACVNPAHLYIGTHADNARDREARGRGRWAKQRAVTA